VTATTTTVAEPLGMVSRCGTLRSERAA